MRAPSAIFNTPARAPPRVFCFSRARRLSTLPDLHSPGTARLFIRTTVTDHHHPVIAQRFLGTSAEALGLPAPANLPPLSPDELRQLLNTHPAQPECSADAI